jgi:hypothetical protein
VNAGPSNLFKAVAAIYDEVLVKKYKDQHFWILSTFIPTFLVARLLVHYYPRIFLQINGQHVHHFAYGIVLLAISGYMAIVRKSKSPAWIAGIFGVGLALAVDETGMWLHLTSQYYNETSENALILAIALLINVVYFRQFWLRLIKSLAGWIKAIFR